MLRVDVPECGGKPAFTRYVAGNSIYAINPCTEEVCLAVLAEIEPRPVYSWLVSELVKKAIIRDYPKLADSIDANNDDYEAFS